MNLFSYYSSKVFAIARTAVLLARHGEKRERGVVMVPGTVTDGPVLFDFSDPTLVHLGDQLFHVPIVGHLVSRSVEVWVDTKNLPQTFSVLGARIGAPERAPRLVVSKNDLAAFSRSRFPESSFLGIHYGTIEGSERVAVAISRLVLAELKLQGRDAGTEADVHYGLTAHPAAPAGAPWAAKAAGIDPGRGLVAWNGYIGSDHFAAKSRMPEVVAKAESLRAEGYRIVHLGSKSEKEKDAASYPFVDLDLRGEIPPDEAVAFFSLPQVAGVLSFDTFLTHAATAADKKLWVVMKRSQDAERFRARFVPFVPGKDELLVWTI